MRSLSKEAERKLISAIEKAASLVNEGAEPTAAIIKSAEEHSIPSGHINLMVHAYNTGATTAQREKGESTLEKAADFKLADAQAVLKALYPETVKSSAEIRRAETVSTEYAVPASDMLARRRNEMQKAASVKAALPEKTWTPPPRDEREAVLRAQSEKMAAQRAEEETRRQATAAYSKAAAALEDLNVYFRTPGNMTFGDALREVNLRLGESGVSVLQKVAAVYPHFTKQADTKQNHFGDDSVYGLVQNVLDSVGAYNDAQAKVSVKKSEAVSQKTAPQFLTGSILVEQTEEPLTLKVAVPIKPRNRPPGSLTHRDDEPESAGGQIFSVEIPAKDNTEKHVDSLVGALDLPSNENATMNAQEDVARAKWRAGIDTQRYLNEQKQKQEAQQRQERIDLKGEPATPEQEQAFDDHLTGDMRRRWREGLDAVEQGKEKEKNETQKKERQETWDKGKSIGQDLGKAFKGDFLGNATAPVKFVGGLLGSSNIGADVFKTPDPNKVLKEQYQQLAMDPSHENALKTIRAKSVLHDMVLNDPVISGYDPQDVAMAFNEIAELAPSLIDTPGMIRPLLRKRLESGQLADFDVKQILDMDKLRADRDKAISETREKNLNML